VLPRTVLLHPSRPSLLRGILLAVGAFVYSLRLGGFPNLAALHATTWQIVPALLAFGGLAETARCIQRKWSLYQAGVLILLYSEVMILGMAVFLYFYP
jgi:hypothetical protein